MSLRPRIFRCLSRLDSDSDGEVGEALMNWLSPAQVPLGNALQQGLAMGYSHP